MPVYEYVCEKCKHEFEAEQRISDEPIRTCPKCRARKVKRLISRTSFVLKGSGWYSDLYASPGAKKEGDAKPGESSDKAAASDAKADSASGSKPETQSETKPAAKSEGKGGKAKAKGKPKAA
jgi:putative FmdB family regulatory protein